MYVSKDMMHTIINYLSYLPIPLFFVLVFLVIKNRKKIFSNLLLLLCSIVVFFVLLILIYARVVEPNLLQVNRSSIEVGFKGRIVLISDIHVGAFSNQSFLEKVVDEINQIEDVDVVVLAGDITYYPREDLTKLLSPLKDLKYPVLAVFGNHDTGHPGPILKKPIADAFEELGITLLENEGVKKDGSGIAFFGFGELWDDEIDIEKWETFYSSNKNAIAIAHNPDTVYEYNEIIPDLTLSGHTHGGQIRLPLIYKYFIPSDYGFNEGLYHTSKGTVFVSSGLGITGLPFRLGIRPVVDVIDLY